MSTFVPATWDRSHGAVEEIYKFTNVSGGWHRYMSRVSGSSHSADVILPGGVRNTLEGGWLGTESSEMSGWMEGGGQRQLLLHNLLSSIPVLPLSLHSVIFLPNELIAGMFFLDKWITAFGHQNKSGGPALWGRYISACFLVLTFLFPGTTFPGENRGKQSNYL